MKKINITSWVLLAAAGLIMIHSSVMAAWQPGLKAGYLNSALDTNNYPTVTEQQLGPHAGATNSFPPWAENRTWVYTGQIYLSGLTYYFAEAIDNWTLLKIDGVTYLYDNDHTTAAKSGAVTLLTGWHDVEIRFGNGTGGAGPNYNLTGWSTTKGFGYNIGGPDSFDGNDYSFPWDDGNMTLFRYDDGTGGVINESATDVTLTNAVFNGQLLSTNLENYVAVYWGPTDGGTNAVAWTNSIDFPYPAAQGLYSTNVTLAATNTLTFYRYFMSNDTLAAWAESTESVLSGELTVEAVDDEAIEGTTDTGVFRVSRPSTAVNGSLTVYFSLGGTAENAVDYTLISSGAVVIPEGETSVDVIIEGIEDHDLSEGDETVTFTLEEGSYIIGSTSTVSVTLHDTSSFDQWAHRIPIVFSGYPGSETLTNFPALVQVSTNINGFSYDGLLSGDYDDLRFTDESQTRLLNYEVESWDNSGTSMVWVQVPALTNSTVIWMYWGRTGMVAPEYTTNGAAWSEGFLSVWHFAETSGTTLKDSVGNYDGTLETGVSLSPTGFIGRGGNFDGAINGGVRLTGMTALQYQHQVTVSGWMNLDTLGTSSTADSCLFTTDGNTDPTLFWYNYSQDTSNDRVYSFNVGNTGLFSNRLSSASGVAEAQTWQYVGGVLNEYLRELYVNGVLLASRPGGINRVNGVTTGYLGKWTGSTNFSHDGDMDEVRLSNVARSADWVQAEYLNMAFNTEFQSFSGKGASLVVSGNPQLFGTPVPGYGTTNLIGGDVFTCTTPAHVDLGNGIGYACIGYEIYTNVIDIAVTGIGNSCTYTNSGGADRLVWLWKKQYQLSVAGSEFGGVFPSNRWFDVGAVVDFTASGLNGGQFVGWQGDPGMTPSQAFDSSITLTFDGPVTITPAFNPPLNPSSWSRRIAIDFDGYDRTETLTNFPIMVRLSEGLANCFSYQDMASPTNAGDLRFTAADEITELFYEVEKWDTNGTSTVWVRLLNLSADNKRIYAYWGNPDETTPPLYTTNCITWDNGYVAVYHLAEDGGPVKDSSPYGNGASVYGDIQQGTDGIAGPTAGWPDGIDDWLQAPKTDSLDGMGQLTIQTWLYNTKNDTLPRGLISKRVNSSSGKSYYFYKHTNNKLSFFVGTYGGEFDDTVISLNQWHFAVATYNKNLTSDRMKVFLDGTFRDGRDEATIDVPVYSSPLYLGIMNDYYDYSGTKCCWQGRLDEVRVSDVARSADWIWTEYNNVNNHDAFMSYHQLFTGTIILIL